MNFLNRLNGLFFEPRKIMFQIAERPVWADVLIFLLIIWIIYSYFVAPFSQKDSLALMKDNVRLKELLGEERYQQRLKQLENPTSQARFLNVFVVSPILFLAGLFLTSLFLFILGKIVSPQGRYVQVMACVLHANIIDKFMGNAIRLGLIFLKKSVFQTSTSLTLLFPRLSFTSPLYIILSQIDFFQLWLFGVLSFGLAAIFKISQRKALVISYSFWLLKSLLYIAVGLINLKYMS